jgi:cyclic pyranopterin phosphate synthase
VYHVLSPAMSPVLDTFARPLRSLRLSVTDRCNLRCEYCMPCEDYVWLERDQLLTFEEMSRLARVFAGLGVTKLRLTGGEPLLRRDLDRLVRLLSAVPAITDIALTTNGLRFEEQAAALHAAGLKRVTISLDTLRPERFMALTRRSGHERVVSAIASAGGSGFEKVKINSVVIRGFNHDELLDLVEFGRKHRTEVRFIEYMDVGGAVRWSNNQVFAAQEMLNLLRARYGEIEPVGEQGSAPAERFRLPDGYEFGIISSTTQPFCGACDRARLTADGVFFLCLYAREGADLKGLLRAGTPEEQIAARIRQLWSSRRDRGAEERLGIASRTPLFQIDELRANPHREMHTRGG